MDHDMGKGHNKAGSSRMRKIREKKKQQGLTFTLTYGVVFG